MLVRKLISGGQTGADRGTTIADDLGLTRGGWAPKGWRSEDGVIPEFFRVGMLQDASVSYRPRTMLNIRDSDATLIMSFGELASESGSMLTAVTARRMGKPIRHVVIPTDGEILGIALDRAREWMSENAICVLNVAGPRESKEPGLQVAARRALAIILATP